MVKATELRIGNLIMVNEIFEEVTHLKPNLIVFAKSVQKKKACRPVQAMPVKLSPGILENYGYSDVGGVNVFCFDFEKKGINYEYDLEDVLNNGKYAFCCNRRILCEIEFLHQLQNIHYHLTDEELTIKNPQLAS